MSNLNSLSPQEVYDIVKSHLLSQGVQSISFIKGLSSCAYRGPNNTSCAVGCLIPDDEYSVRMEGKTVKGLISDCIHIGLSNALRNFISAHRDLLADLQLVHDTQFIKNWPEALANVAIEHDLTP